jgi:hypothetical protein
MSARKHLTFPGILNALLRALAVASEQLDTRIDNGKGHKYQTAQACTDMIKKCDEALEGLNAVECRVTELRGYLQATRRLIAHVEGRPLHPLDVGIPSLIPLPDDNIRTTGPGGDA